MKFIHLLTLKDIILSSFLMKVFHMWNDQWKSVSVILINVLKHKLITFQWKHVFSIRYIRQNLACLSHTHHLLKSFILLTFFAKLSFVWMNLISLHYTSTLSFNTSIIFSTCVLCDVHIRCFVKGVKIISKGYAILR